MLIHFLPAKAKIVGIVALMLVAQVSPMPSDWIAGLREFGSMLILGAGVYYFLKHALPDMIANHRSESQSQRNDFIEALAQQRKDHELAEAQQRTDYLGSIREHSKSLQDLTQIMMSHDRDMRIAHGKEQEKLLIALREHDEGGNR